MIAWPPPLRHRRAAFWIYAAALFTATHWPQLGLPAPGRPDLLAHALAFGLWATLLMAAAFFGSPLSGRNIVWSLAIAAGVAAFDEWSQRLPILGRVSTIEDALANFVGIGAAGLGALMLGPARSRRDGPPAEREAGRDPSS